MPKYIEPKDAVGLLLRAVIEGEVFNQDLGLNHQQVKAIADAVEERIQDGPADWLSLSNGTTFTKTFVPHPELVERQTLNGYGVANWRQPVERWPQFGGHIDTSLIDQVPGSDDPMHRTIESIHAAHEQRVKENTERAQAERLDILILEVKEADTTELSRRQRRVFREIGLELDIQAFEQFQASIGGGIRR